MSVSYILSAAGIGTEDKKRRSAQIRKQITGCPIEQYTIDGTLIKIFPYSSAVAVDGFDQDEVNRCCAHKARSHKGFLWKRTSDTTPIQQLVIAYQKKHKQSQWRYHLIEIDKESLYDNYISSNHTLKDTARHFQCSVDTIINRAKKYGFSKKINNFNREKQINKRTQIIFIEELL